MGAISSSSSDVASSGFCGGYSWLSTNSTFSSSGCCSLDTSSISSTGFNSSTGFSSGSASSKSSSNTGGCTSSITGGYTSSTTGGYTSSDTGGYTSSTTGGYTSSDTGGCTSSDTGGCTSSCYASMGGKSGWVLIVASSKVLRWLEIGGSIRDID